jgi:hypothetical protein
VIRRRHLRRRGQSMVEFAMVAPVLFALIFAGIDFGGYFASRLSVENAARVAVRAAAVEVCPDQWDGFRVGGQSEHLLDQRRQPQFGDHRAGGDRRRLRRQHHEQGLPGFG